MCALLSATENDFYHKQTNKKTHINIQEHVISDNKHGRSSRKYVFEKHPVTVISVNKSFPTLQILAEYFVVNFKYEKKKN